MTAFERVLRLGERLPATVHIVACAEEPPAALLQKVAALGGNPRAVVAADALAEQLDEFASIAQRHGIAATAGVLVGPAFLTLLGHVRGEGYDLLVKASEPANLLHTVLFGHLDRQLVRRCPCPVWIEKASERRRHERILAAVDPLPYREDGVRQDLDVAILDAAVEVAHALEAELHVAHVWPFYSEGTLRTRAGLTDEAILKVGDSIRREHQESFAKLLEPYRGFIARKHLIKGYAGEEISRLAANQSIDAIVMGTMCRTGIEGFLIGNTAETVLDQVDCSLLALKPRGFGGRDS